MFIYDSDYWENDVYYKYLEGGGAEVFYYQGTKEKLSLPERIPSDVRKWEVVTSIAKEAFCGSSFQHIKLPAKLQRIEYAAFIGCEELKSITIPASVIYMGSHIFKNCTTLEEVVFEPGCTMVAECMFSQCKSLRRVVLPDSIIEIGSYAFAICSNLEEIVLPPGLKRIGRGAFDMCSGLKHIELPDSLESLGENAFQLSGLEEARLPGGMEKLEDGVFRFCHKLSRATLPDHLIEIGDEAFRETLFSERLSWDEEKGCWTMRYDYTDSLDWLNG